MLALTPAEFERAKTWLSVIAEALLVDPEWVQEGDERKYNTTGGLHINMAGKGWFDHSADDGGYSAVHLVMHLKSCGYLQAIQWLVLFLASSPGTGPCGAGGDGDDDDSSPASAADCEDILDQITDVADTSATYLKGRNLPGPYPAGLLGHLDDARIGESAFVAKLTDHGRVVGVQLGYLTPTGEKSLIQPIRRRFNLEKAPGAVFRIPAPDPAAALDSAADYLLCEGIEDALSLAQLQRNLTIFGVPGIGALRHLDLPKGARVIVVKDGDEPDSKPAEALTAGVDALLLAGVKVRVTDTPLGFDSNRLLQEQGLDALRDLVSRPVEATLSYHGRVLGLSRVDAKDRVKFAAERKAIASVFGVSVKAIDEDLAKLRPPAAAAPGSPPADDDVPGGYEGASDLEWEGEVDFAAALDSAVASMKRFLKAPDYVYDTTALWSAMTYLVQSEEIDMPIAPQLGFQSIVEGSGKSVVAEIVAAISYRGYLRSGYTASTLFRRINQEFITPCLSEYHNILSEKDKALLSVVNACHRRSEAWIDRTETDAQTGRRYVQSYKCWTALSWGAIGAVPREAHSRSIVLPMQAALPDESRALDHSRPLQAKDLIDVRRQLAKWSATIKVLPTPSMPPTLFNRAADNFRPLFALAELAGGDWPQRIRNAAEAIGKVERKPTLQVRLLTDIRDAFEAAEDQRLPTGKLIDTLCEEEERGWQQENRGKRIDAYWLRENLRGLINPAGSQRWREGTHENDPLIRGYELSQFRDAFLRYLSSPSLEGGGPASGTSGTEPRRPKDTAMVDVPDAEFDPAHHPAQENPRKSATGGPSVPDVLDVPDAGPPPPREGI